MPVESLKSSTYRGNNGQRQKKNNSGQRFVQDCRANTQESVKVSTQILVSYFSISTCSKSTVHHKIPQYRCWKKRLLLVVLIIVKRRKRKSKSWQPREISRKNDDGEEKKSHICSNKILYSSGRRRGRSTIWKTLQINVPSFSSSQDVV